MDANLAWIRDALEKTGTKRIELARILGIRGEAVSRLLNPDGSEQRGLKKDEWDKIVRFLVGKGADPPPGYRGDSDEYDMPIYGAVLDGGEYIDIETPVRWYRTPAFLKGVRNIYAVRISGDLMEERYRHGEMLWVSPEKPPRRDDFVCVELTGGRAIVRRFLGMKPDNSLELEQLNPKKRITIKRDDWRQIFRVVGAVEG